MARLQIDFWNMVPGHPSRTSKPMQGLIKRARSKRRIEGRVSGLPIMRLCLGGGYDLNVALSLDMSMRFPYLV
jgi:hypothetical protein